MPMGNAAAQKQLRALYNGTAYANIVDNAASVPATNLYLSLHTAMPTKAGTQATNEAAYTGYARAAVARNSTGLTVTNNVITLTANISFPKCTAASSEVELWGALGPGSSGATDIWDIFPLGVGLGPFNAKTSDTLTIAGLSGLAVSDQITFLQPPGSVLPTGIAEGTVYFVKTLSGDDITISATNGGAAIDVTAVGDGTAYKVTPITMALNVVPILDTGTTITKD